MINIDLLKGFGEQQKVDWQWLFAILMKESHGKGFHLDGHLKTRFEPAINRLLQKKYNNKYPEHDINLMSFSYGMPQIMGYHFEIMDYANIGEMYNDFNTNEHRQQLAFLKFVERYNNGRFLEAVRNSDVISIARQYNGKNFTINNYDKDLKYFYEIAKNE